jgi:hypothetical protein
MMARNVIIDKDEERTDRILKSIKDNTNDIKSSDNANSSYIIGSMKLKFDRIMGSLKLIFIVLAFSQFINMVLLLALCYHFGIIG